MRNTVELAMGIPTARRSSAQYHCGINVTNVAIYDSIGPCLNIYPMNSGTALMDFNPNLPFSNMNYNSDHLNYLNLLPFQSGSSGAENYDAYNFNVFDSLAGVTIPCGNSQVTDNLPTIAPSDTTPIYKDSSPPTTASTTASTETNNSFDDGENKKRKRNREEEENAALMLPEGTRRAHKPRRLPDGESAMPVMSKRSRKK
jgi:hypothetical protein